MSWYLERMAFAREALSEGLCPLCGARLSPYVEGSEHGGYCAEHGRFTVDCDMWASIPSLYKLGSAVAGRSGHGSHS